MICIIFFNTGLVFAQNDCPEVTKTLKAAGKAAEKKVKDIIETNIPKASTYNDLLTACLGALTSSFNISILGFIPDINSIIAGLCSQIISQISLPDLNYDMEIDLGLSKYAVPITMNQTLINDVWAEAWLQQ